MRWIVVAALLARPAAADPAVDYERARLHALTAHNLAHDGRCTEALAMRPRIEELDAEVARVAYTTDPLLVACARPQLEPPSRSPLVAPPSPPHKACSTRGYLEPSMLALYESGQPTLFTRVGAGVLFRTCTSPIQVRVGGTTYAGRIGEIGVGGETELSAALSDDLRLGFHVAYETAHGGSLESADLRLHIRDGAWLQAGASAWSRYEIDSGIGVGVGFEGGPGAVVGVAELVLGGLLVIFAASYGGG